MVFCCPLIFGLLKNINTFAPSAFPKHVSYHP
jgi:hypothetical protein